MLCSLLSFFLSELGIDWVGDYGDFPPTQCAAAFRLIREPAAWRNEREVFDLRELVTFALQVDHDLVVPALAHCWARITSAFVTGALKAVVTGAREGVHVVQGPHHARVGPCCGNVCER